MTNEGKISAILNSYKCAIKGAEYDRQRMEDNLVYQVKQGSVKPDAIQGRLDRIKSEYENCISDAENIARWKLLQIADGKPIDGIRVEGHRGKWYVIDVTNTVKDHKPMTLLLLEHETYGSDAASVITDSGFNLIMDDVWNGFDDYFEAFPED